MTADITELASVLSSCSRVEMLVALGERERTVTELAHVAGIGVASASFHIAKMAESGLVQVHPYGNRRMSAALTGRPRGGRPIEMPTPIEVLTTIGNTLATEGYIKGFDPPSSTIDPLDMNFNVTLINGTKAPIKCRHELYANVLVFTEGACVGMQVELREKLRKTVVKGKKVVAVTAAIKNLSDYFHSLLPVTSCQHHPNRYEPDQSGGDDRAL